SGDRRPCEDTRTYAAAPRSRRAQSSPGATALIAGPDSAAVATATDTTAAVRQVVACWRMIDKPGRREAARTYAPHLLYSDGVGGRGKGLDGPQPVICTGTGGAGVCSAAIPRSSGVSMGRIFELF